MAAGDLAGAARAFAGALAESPDSPGIYSNLASIRGRLGETGTARDLMERAIRIAPKVAELHYNLGNLRRAAGDFGNAGTAYREAAALRPLYAQAYSNLGECLVAAGDGAARRALLAACCADPAMTAPLLNLGVLENEHGAQARAVSLFERVLRIDPANSRAWYNRSLEVKARPGDGTVAAMEELIAGAGSEDRILLSFALGKGWSELGNPEKAFRHYEQGNRRHRAGYDYDSGKDVAALRSIAEAFPQERAAALIGGTAPRPRLLFIVGMPRSGTTLIEQILSTHSRIHGAGEVPLFDRLMKERRPEGRDELIALGNLYRERMGGEAELTIDKLPVNIRHAGAILAALPSAVIVRCRRDAVDTCWSCYSHHFSEPQPFAYDLAELGAYCRAIEELATHWRRVLPPARYTEIVYEDLIGHPREEIARLLAFCGMDWEEECLNFHANRRRVRTASLGQVRQPLYRGAIGKARAFDPFLGPLREALGETLTTPVDAGRGLR